MRRLILLLIAVSLSLRVAAADSETEVVSASQIDLSANEREYLITKQQYTQLLTKAEELEQRLKATVDTKTSLVELKRSGQEIAVLSLQIKDLIQRLDNLYAQLEADKSPVLNESRLVIAHLGVNPMQGSSRHVTSLAADQRFFGNLALAGGAQAGEIAIVLEIRQAESGAVLARKAVTRQNGQPTQLQEFWELVPGELPANQSLELSVIAKEGKANPISGKATFELVSSPEPLEAASDQTTPKLASKRDRTLDSVHICHNYIIGSQVGAKHQVSGGFNTDDLNKFVRGFVVDGLPHRAYQRGVADGSSGRVAKVEGNFEPRHPNPRQSYRFLPVAAEYSRFCSDADLAYLIEAGIITFTPDHNAYSQTRGRGSRDAFKDLLSARFGLSDDDKLVPLYAESYDYRQQYGIAWNFNADPDGLYEGLDIYDPKNCTWINGVCELDPYQSRERGDEIAADGTDGDDSWCQVIKAAEEGDGNNFIRCSPRFIEFCTDSYGCTAFERDDLTAVRRKAFEESRLDDLISKIYEEWEEMAELISFRVVQQFQKYGSQPAGESSYLNLSSEAKGCLADVSESGEQLMSRIRNISKREIEAFVHAKQAAQATSDIPFVASFDESTMQTSWSKRANKIKPFAQDLISFVLRPSVEDEWQYYRQSHVSTCGCITRRAQALYSLDIMTADTFDTIRENSLRLGCRDLFYYLN